MSISKLHCTLEATQLLWCSFLLIQCAVQSCAFLAHVSSAVLSMKAVHVCVGVDGMS